MSSVTRLGDSCTGHDCFSPRNSSSGSPNVFVNGRRAHRQGDSWETHCCTHPEVPHGCHAGSLSSGSSSVLEAQVFTSTGNSSAESATLFLAALRWLQEAEMFSLEGNMIGSFGEVVFEVSAEWIRTFRDFQIQHSAKYAEHSIAGRKGLLEFTGLGASTASLNIRLDAGLGINPKEELKTLREILAKHEALPFILDGEPQGDGLWVLESISENYEIIDSHGTAIAVEVSIKLKEYEVSIKLKEYIEVSANGD